MTKLIHTSRLFRCRVNLFKTFCVSPRAVLCTTLKDGMEERIIVTACLGYFHDK